MTREEAITVLKAFMENPLFSDVHKNVFNIAIHDIKQRHDWDINKLMLVPKTEREQEPCEDATLKDIFCMGCEYKEQEPCDDAISRAWLKEAIHNFYYGLKHTPTEEDIQAYIDAAPPVTPKQKMGRWIREKKHHKDDFQEFDYWDVRCSECGARKRIGWTNVRHCPMCGAKMSENPTGSESEDTE